MKTKGTQTNFKVDFKNQLIQTETVTRADEACDPILPISDDDMEVSSDSSSDSSMSEAEDDPDWQVEENLDERESDHEENENIVQYVHF